MRSAWIPILVLAACGGDATPPGDGQPGGIDAPGGGIDATIDSRPIDGPDIDAAVDAPVDAPVDAQVGGCAGMLIGGFCWYKGNLSQSCNGVCATHGGANMATVTYAGAATAGSRANQAHCQSIATALSTLAFSAATTSVGAANDFGCGEEPGNNRTELISASVTTVFGASPLVRRFCACNM